jgi:hypothetical protein
MTWQEYLELSNQAYPDAAMTEASIDPVNYAYFQDDIFITVDAEGNNLFAIADSPLFATIEELDNWVYANTNYAEDNKRIIQELEDQRKFVDRLLNRTYKKKTRYLRKTIDKLYTIYDAGMPTLPYNLKDVKNRFSTDNLQLTESLTPEQRKDLERARDYRTITPALKSIPQILTKYKKNPISLSEKLKIDGVKKEELALLQNVIDAIRSENPNKKSITGEEFVNETYLFLEANYMLGFANELDHLGYNMNNIFEDTQLPSGDPVLHQKISIRFNDTYYKRGHFSLSPSAFASLTAFPQGKSGKVAVLLHEIQNDQIETLRQSQEILGNLSNPLERYLEDMNSAIESARANINKGGLTAIKVNPLDLQMFRSDVYQKIIGNFYENNDFSYTQFRDLYKHEQIYKETPAQYTDTLRAQQGTVDILYTNINVIRSIKASGGFEQFLTEGEINQLSLLIENANQSNDPRNTFDFNLDIFNNMVSRIKTRYPDFNIDRMDTRNKLINSFKPASKPRTNRTVLNGSLDYLFKIVMPQKATGVFNKEIVSVRKDMLMQFAQRNRAYFIESMLKLTRDEFGVLVDNVKYNYSELAKLGDLAAQRALNEKAALKDLSGSSALMDNFIKEAEKYTDEAIVASEKQAGAIEGARGNLEKLLAVELQYFMPLVHQVIQTHIKQYGKETPLFFSGSDLTNLTQSYKRTSQIYAGPEEVKYSKTDVDIIKYKPSKVFGVPLLEYNTY